MPGLSLITGMAINKYSFYKIRIAHYRCATLIVQSKPCDAQRPKVKDGERCLGAISQPKFES
jgi:hypothetical protein